MSELPVTPLELDGWLEYNAWRTGLRPRRFGASDGGSEIRAVFYVGRGGRLWLPANNPYLPLVFRSAKSRPNGRTSDWLAAVGPLVEEMRRRGVANGLMFPPNVEDVRPWRWAGFLVGVKYTYCLDFPIDPGCVDKRHLRSVETAAGRGLSVDRSDDLDAVVGCLGETEERQHFSYRLGSRELVELRSRLGDDAFRAYVCRDAAGRAASTCVVIHVPGSRAIGWVAGARRESLADGAGHAVWRFAFNDLTTAGATGIDLCGANIRSVAEFKARWGARLEPTYTVRTYSLRAAARFSVDWLTPHRAGMP